MSQPAALPLGDRLMAALRAILQAEDPQRIYRGCWEYFVQSSDGTNCDMAPTDTTVPLPPLRNIPMRAGLPGTVGTPTNGTKCYVMFANADPGKPVIVGYDTPSAQKITVKSSGTVAVTGGTVNVNGSSPAAARNGDSVSVTFTSAMAAQIISGGSGSPCSLPGGSFSITGTITSGSGTVNIGG